MGAKRPRHLLEPGQVGTQAPRAAAALWGRPAGRCGNVIPADLPGWRWLSSDLASGVVPVLAPMPGCCTLRPSASPPARTVGRPHPEAQGRGGPAGAAALRGGLPAQGAAQQRCLQR